MTRVRADGLSPLVLVFCMGRHVELLPLTVNQVGPGKDWNSECCEAQSGDSTELERPAPCPRAWVGDHSLTDKDS